MRFVRLVGAIAIAIAFVATAIAPIQGGPRAAAAAGDPVVLVDSYLTSPTALLASGSQVLVDYGNGYYLMRAPREAMDALRGLAGVDPLDGRTGIDLYFSRTRFDTAIAEPALAAPTRRSLHSPSPPPVRPSRSPGSFPRRSSRGRPRASSPPSRGFATSCTSRSAF